MALMWHRISKGCERSGSPEVESDGLTIARSDGYAYVACERTAPVALKMRLAVPARLHSLVLAKQKA